jgi:3-hydroxypropanoate dehydrogenase
LGLDAGAMSGFDNKGVDNEFFRDTSIKSNFLCTLGYGREPKGHSRGARYNFDEVANII